MKIEKIELFQSPIKLKKPFVISLETLTHANNILVVMHTNEGITGYGECSPFMSINGESMESAFENAKHLAGVLVGEDPRNIDHCIHRMHKVLFANSSIKSAFDIALYDISSQAAGKPLYEFLGGRNDKTLMTDYTISIGPAEKMALDAIEIRDRGFRVIKVKLGENAEKDLERIRQIREAIGFDIPLRIDANQGWQEEEAIGVLKDLAPYNIQFCEEPIARWNYLRLSHIKKESPIPVMADESCCNHQDAAKLIHLGAADYFNVKLGKSGGIHDAIKIIQLAEGVGIRMQMGGFLESRLGFTASAHVALCSGQVMYQDFDTPLMFDEEPVEGGIQYLAGGIIQMPKGNGLGASISREYLDSLVCASIGE